MIAVVPAHAQIAYIPLDDRPCNRRDPVLLARIAGVCIDTPPRRWLGRFTLPGDPARLARWLERRDGAAARVVSLDMLASGGLVASREPNADRMAALGALEHVGLRAPGRAGRKPAQTLAFLVLLRPTITVKRARDLAVWRTLFEALSTARRAPHRPPAGVPARMFRAHLIARAQQLDLARGALAARASGLIERLFLFQEDCRPGGLPGREQEELAREAERCGLGDASERLCRSGTGRRGQEEGRDGSPRVGDSAVQPGADEAGMLLVARAILGSRAGPRIRVVWGTDGLGEAVAPYEDRPLGDTVRAKLATAGAREVRRGEDVILYVHGGTSPHGSPTFADGFLADTRHVGGRTGRDCRAVESGMPRRLASLLAEGRSVAVADVAVANAADDALVRGLLGAGAFSGLWSYAAWNTAANTVGTVVAHIVALWCSRDSRPLQSAAHRHWMTHRLLEDYVYATLVRPHMQRWFAVRELDAFAGLPGAAARTGGATAASMERFRLGALADRALRSLMERQAGPALAALGLCPGPAPAMSARSSAPAGRIVATVGGANHRAGAPAESCPGLRASLPWGRTFEAEVCASGLVTGMSVRGGRDRRRSMEECA